MILIVSIVTHVLHHDFGPESMLVQKNIEKGRHKGSQKFGTPLSGGSERYRSVQVFDTWEET